MDQQAVAPTAGAPDVPPAPMDGLASAAQELSPPVTASAQADSRAVGSVSSPAANNESGAATTAQNMPAPAASLGGATASFGIGSGLKIPQFTTGSKLRASASLFSTSSSLLGRPLGAANSSMTAAPPPSSQGPQLRPVMLKPAVMPYLGTSPSTVTTTNTTTTTTSTAPTHAQLTQAGSTGFPQQQSRLGGTGGSATFPPPFPNLKPRGVLGTGSLGFVGTPMSRTSVLSMSNMSTMSNPHRLSQVSASPGNTRNPAMSPGQEETDGTPAQKVIITNVEDRLLSLESEFNGDFTVNGIPLILDVDKPTTPANTGFRVWDAGIVMSKYFEHLHSQQKTFIKKKVLELGCGSGIGGLSFALLGHDVFLTDQPEIQSRTQKNIMSNATAISQAGGHATFQVLDWNLVDRMHGLGPGNEFGTFDIVIASDVIWANSFIKPFLKTLQKVTTETTKIYMGHKTRSEEIDTNFMDALGEFGFELAETILPHDVIDHKYSLQKVSIYVFRRKPAEAPEDAVEKAENEEGSQPEAAAQEMYETPLENTSSNDDVGAELGEA